jgi:DNA polymerase III sliding clamp (beta) subunit (PCNA family)
MERMSTDHIFEAHVEDFSSAIRWTAKVTKGASNPLISIAISDGKMVLSAFDGMVSVKSKCDVTQKFTGELNFTVNGTILANAIKNIKDSSVVCNVNGRTLTIKTKSSRFSLPIAMPRTALVLPPLPAILGKVDAAQFKTFINNAAGATSDDATAPPALSVVHFAISPRDHKIKMVATDRYKLIVRAMDYTPEHGTENNDDFAVSVDARHLKALLAELADDDTLTVYTTASADAGQFGLATSTQVGSALIKDVKYLDYQRLLATNPSYRIVVNRNELNRAITTTKPLIEGNIKDADFVISADGFRISTPMTDIECDVKNSNLTEELTVHVNLDYLTPIIGSGKSEFVALSLETPLTPLLVQEMNDASTINPNYFNMVMPIRR